MRFFKERDFILFSKEIRRYMSSLSYVVNIRSRQVRIKIVGPNHRGIKANVNLLAVLYTGCRTWIRSNINEVKK